MIEVRSSKNAGMLRQASRPDVLSHRCEREAATAEQDSQSKSVKLVLVGRPTQAISKTKLPFPSVRKSGKRPSGRKKIRWCFSCTSSARRHLRLWLGILSYGLRVKVEDYHSHEAQQGFLLSTSPCLCAALQVSTLQDAVASQAMTALANLVSPISHCAMKEPRASTCGSRHML